MKVFHRMLLRLDGFVGKTAARSSETGTGGFPFLGLGVNAGSAVIWVQQGRKTAALIFWPVFSDDLGICRVV